MKTRFAANILIGLTLLSPAFGQTSVQSGGKEKGDAKSVYVIAGRLFDGTSDSLSEKSIIVIESGRIQQVGSATAIKVPSGAEVIDLSGATVLPGLMDCHTHLGMRADRYDEIYDFKDSP